jgi:hypothetical protein
MAHQSDEVEQVLFCLRQGVRQERRVGANGMHREEVRWPLQREGQLGRVD